MIVTSDAVLLRDEGVYLAFVINGVKDGRLLVDFTVCVQNGLVG